MPDPVTPKAVRSAIDLTAAAAHFAEKDQHKRFVKAVARLNDAESAQFDLKTAAALMETGMGTVARHPGHLPEATQDGDKARLAGAAFSYALMLYARIVTNNDDRGRVPLEEGAQQDVKDAHARIVLLRHKGVGHFGYTTDHPGGALARDRVLVMDDGAGPYLSHEHHRANYREKNLIDLCLVIHHGSIKIRSIIEERAAQVITELRRLPLNVKTEINSFKITCAWDDEFETTSTPSGRGAI